MLASLAAAALAGSCKESFDPIAPSNAHFSVFGYLDASADTQWIRVMPLRALKVTSPDSFGDVVTLQNVGTGQLIQLRDSMLTFTQRSNSGLVSGKAYVHDFWTTQRIEPGASYQFSAKLDTGQAAEAVVDIPQDYALEVWLAQLPRDSDRLEISGLKHLPFLAQVAHFYDGGGPGVDTLWYKGSSSADGTYDVPIARMPVAIRNVSWGRPVVLKRQLWTVGSEDAWPSSDVYSPLGLGAAEQASNVSNGVGFLGGVLTKLIPYEHCTFETGGALVPRYCKLRYDQQSAYLSGTVTETLCGDGPIDSVAVQMTEIDGTPPEIRSDTTGFDGTFEVGALDPGMRYALKVRAKPLPVYGSGEIDIYTIVTDTLTFTAGERRTYDVGLQRLTPCDQKP